MSRLAARNRAAITISDDDDLPRVVASRTVTRSPAKSKKRRLPEPDDIIEITSSDEENQPRKRQASVPLKDQLKQLQHDNRNLMRQCSKLEGELGHARKEIGELKLASNRLGGVGLDAAQLEDYVSCEICSTTMWTPYILSGCGHSFCLKCLVEWFGTSLQQHMATHPGWRFTNQIPLHTLHPRMRGHPYIATVIAQQGPQPEYTCPTCRAAVLTRPVEDYSLKAIVRAVATSAGEASPQKDPPAVKRRKGKAKAADGPLDGFFGRDT
ncbi:hypothetical protein B0H10DRAFT_2081196 [Mycena sp. CBHHK59/15]|nr:hypothetical protein B0H10DRAFT_2081196 [Mycena sp. CBHHK59/15]